MKKIALKGEKCEKVDVKGTIGPKKNGKRKQDVEKWKKDKKTKEIINKITSCGRN